MTKSTSLVNRIVSVVGVLLSVGSLCYFVEEIWRKWDTVAESLQMMRDNTQLLLTEVTLCVVGFVIEAMRWGTIMHGRTSTSMLTRDLLTVLRASAYASATPGGLGEHAARVECESDKGDGLSASVMASVLQTACISVLGMVGAGLLWKDGSATMFPIIGAMRVVVAILVIAVTLIALTMFTVRRVRQFMLSHVEIVGWRSLRRAALLNMLRVVCFSIQLSLLLTMGEELTSTMMELVFVYYMILTYCPRIAWLDLGLKGSLGMLVFGEVATQDLISASVMVLWVVNIVCPALVYYVCWGMGRK